MKVYLHGQDNVGWSIDSDRRHLDVFLRDIGLHLTRNFVMADVLHSVWWNQLLSDRNFLLRFKRNIIATATNQITPESQGFRRAKKVVSLWIAPSLAQEQALRETGVRVVYQPFYVSEKTFTTAIEGRAELCSRLGIDWLKLKGKFIISSFQRDTIGSDLVSPKWQKGPERLLNILAALPEKDKWLLLLAGPRRHYVINECRKRNIPYYYYGKEPVAGVDDVFSNTVAAVDIARLYNLTDCYMITSNSEGGPKAVPEASWCKTPILSTKVGMATDILSEYSLYSDDNTAISRIMRMISGMDRDSVRVSVDSNFNKVQQVMSYTVVKKRWEAIYAEM